MLKIYPNNGDPIYIRPTPLISISHTPLKNKMGSVGSTYDIVLTGTIIAHDGSPMYDPATNLVSFHTNKVSDLNNISYLPVTDYDVDIGDRLKSIVLKQNALRDLFSVDGQKIEITSLDDQEKAIVFYPNFVSVNFEEGLYVDTCKYTINLQAPLLFDKNNEIFTEGLIGITFSPNKYDLERTSEFYLRDENSRTIEDVIDKWGGIVEDFSDTWSIETDETNGQTVGLTNIPLSYRVTRNVSATGREAYASGDTGIIRYEPWEQAVGFIKKTLLQEPQASPDGNGYTIARNKKYQQYPGFRVNDDPNAGLYGSGSLNLPSFYRGYNHVRTFNIDKTAGSCSVSDTWLLASGQSHLENYTISISQSLDSPMTNVKIDGTIKGLSDLHASGYLPENFDDATTNTPYKKALDKYFDISNDGKFGVGSILYQRANNSVINTLNSQPLSISLATNEINGEITYSLEFDDRPYNYFGGVLGENISVSDTYPGDVFAVIPVIGRKTGPVLQYLKGRTEYKRNVNIEILLDYTDISYSSSREHLLLNKPSLNTPIRNQLQELIVQLSPKGEPYVTQYFLNPPQESWSPKEGRYTISLAWDYKKSV